MATKSKKKLKNVERSLRFNKGKLQWKHFPLFLLRPLMEVAQYGGLKYTAYNYLKGAPITEIMDSLKRHLDDFESPYEEDVDKESKVNHMAHVAWNALFITYIYKYMPSFDDRYKVLRKSKK